MIQDFLNREVPTKSLGEFHQDSRKLFVPVQPVPLLHSTASPGTGGHPLTTFPSQVSQ
jgi:hypothetical protein